MGWNEFWSNRLSTKTFNVMIKIYIRAIQSVIINNQGNLDKSKMCNRRYNAGVAAQALASASERRLRCGGPLDHAPVVALALTGDNGTIGFSSSRLVRSSTEPPLLDAALDSLPLAALDPLLSSMGTLRWLEAALAVDATQEYDADVAQGTISLFSLGLVLRAGNEPCES